jgi:hypothetical protein
VFLLMLVKILIVEGLSHFKLQADEGFRATIAISLAFAADLPCAFLPLHFHEVSHGYCTFNMLHTAPETRFMSKCSEHAAMPSKLRSESLWMVQPLCDESVKARTRRLGVACVV